jgi:hypothetical protein
MKRNVRLLAMLVLASLYSLQALAQTIPPIKGKALDDSDVVLPKPGGQQYLILVIGFSHKSGELCGGWGKRITADFSSDPHVTLYQLAELQAAPSLIRGMIVHGMRKDVPATQHSHFVPLYDHEDEWKKLVSFSAPDDAYVLLTTPDGKVLWQARGAVNDNTYGELKAAVAKSLPASAKP